MHEHQYGINGISCLGWTISPDTLSSFIFPARRQQIMGILKKWSRHGLRMSLAELRSVTGILFFVTNGFFLGRASLLAIFKLKSAAEAIALRTNRSSTAATVPLSKAASSTIAFWYKHFSAWDGSRLLAPLQGPGSGWFSIWRGDSSTEFGCGAINESLGEFFSLPWLPEERARAFRDSAESAPFLEALCCLYQVRFWGENAKGRSVLLECDCLPACQALRKGYSPDIAMNFVANEFHHLIAFYSINLTLKHIFRNRNTVPDFFSRGPRCHEEAIALWKKESPMLGVRVERLRSSIGLLFSEI
jgi:hypothetical protein